VVAGSFALFAGLSKEKSRDRCSVLAWPLFTSQRATDFHSALPIGVGINFVNIDPIKALFWSTVINGVVAVPLRSSG
jgi:hypothetical protein